MYNLYYYIAIAILTLSLTYQQCHPILWTLLLYLMMYMIFLAITKLHRSALLLMVIVTTGLCIVSYTLNRITEPTGQDPNIEGFQSSTKKSSNPDDMESFTNEIKKIIEDADQFQQKMKAATPAQSEPMENQDPVPRINRNIAKTYATDTDTLNIADMDRIRDGHDSDEEGTMTQKKKTHEKQISIMTPAEAQRETFKLINTVQQLEQTMQAMSPTIEQGKQIINMLGSLAPSLQMK